MTADIKYFNHMFEIIIDQNKAVLEVVGDMQERMKLLATQKSLDELSRKVSNIERAVIDNRKDHDALEKRVGTLESKTA